ncbi:uncharacterized protein AB675_6645 [Cyphellophora attinorum]|uniref:Protein ECM13 n=1 Tax=Cyphellophora attinorum TaxID=1664694 RepID=A0A0N1HEL1_9EURO|nr:uncharacterized protein AB675_6645 [Phialophora attinorum]KPI43304.1 hypothetical protein AB675_6645 [Phialophora attinorum]
MPTSITFSNTTKGASAHSIYSRSQKKSKPSLTQTYYMAHSARSKLSREAAKGDHDLRLLVLHANTLDHLMEDLSNAEADQERWFNKTVSSPREEEEEEEESHVETIAEEDEDDSQITAVEVDSDMEEDDETDVELTLTRTPSRHSPPALTIDSDSDSEDESMPPSPPQPTFELTEQQRQAIATTSFYDPKDVSLSPVDSEAFESEGFYLPSRQQPTLIAAY